MRVPAFVILCCALQYITSQIIEEKIDNILNDKTKYETKNEITSDEFEINRKTGKMYEKRTTHKEFLSKNGYGSDGNECDVEIIEFFFTKDDQGRERIFEDDTTIKKVDIPVTYTSSSSASAASQTPQSNSSVATGSAASATAGAQSTSSAASAVITQGPESRSTSAASSSSSRSGAGDLGNIHGTQESSEGSEEGGAYGNASGRGGIHGTGSGSSGSPSNSPTKQIDETRTRLPESRPESKPASTASGNRRPGLDLYGLKYNGKYFPEIRAAAAKAAAGGVGPDSYRPGYYRQDYLSPQDLLTIDDNVGGSATDTNIPESGSSGTPGASPTTKEGVSGTQQPGSGPASKPVDNITGNNQNELVPDSYGSGYYGQDYLSPQDLLTTDDNVGGSATDTNIPESGSSGTPGASPTTKEGVSGTQRPESGPESKPASTASGNRRPGLDLYGSKYNGKYYPEISSAAATAVAGAFGTTSSSSARTQGPESKSTSAASSSSSRSVAGASGSIHGTQGSSERSEEGGAYGNASGRGGIHGPGSGSSGSPSNSPTKKIDETRTRLPESRPVPKPASTASGNRRPGLDLYGSKYNGKYYPEISSAAATAVAGAFGTTSSSSARTQGPESKSTSAASSSSSRSDAGASGSIHGTQGSSERSEEGGAYGNASGRGGIHGPGAGSSGSPSNSPTKKIDEKRTRLPESRPESKPASTASGNRRPGLDLYGLKYNGKYFPEISAAAAKAAAGGVGPDSYRPGYYRQDYLSPQDLLTIDDNVGGSATDTNIPESGSSGTSGASPTIKEGVSGTQQQESGPASKPVDNITGNNQNEIGPDSYGSGYYGQDYLSPQDLLTIDDNVGGSATDTNIPESGSSGTSGASPTTKAGVSGTQQPESGPASKPVDNITGNNQNEIVPDSYGSGYYGQDYLSPQDLLTTDDNVGGSATDTNIPESGSSGTPGASPTTKEGVSGTQRPESGPESKPASTASGNRRPGLDLYGSKYNGKYYPEISSAAATAVAGAFGTTSSSSAGNQGPEGKSTSAASSSSSSSVAGASGSIHGTQGSSERSEEGRTYGNALGRGGFHGPGSGSSGSPSNSPTKKIDEKRTRLPESRPESKPASTASGNRRPGLDLYGLKYNGKYFPEISAAAAKAAAGGVGPDSYRPGYYRQDYLSPQDLLTIDDNVGGSATDTNIPESGSSGTSGASPTTKEGVSGTQQPESGPASKPVDNITGNNQNEIGPDSYGSGYYGQDYLSPRDLLTIDDNVGGLATDTNIPESGSSGTPGASPTTKEGVSGTQRPESGPVLKPASSASGNRRPGLDLYGSKYNGKYYPEISSAAATAVAGAFGTTSSSSARTHGPESRSTSTASSSSSRSGAGASGSIHGTQGSSERSEEGGAYGNASGRGGVHGPGSGSSGSPSNSPTKKIDETRTRLPESRPVPKPASTASGNRRPGLDLYGLKYNGKYFPEIRAAAAKAAAGGVGPDSYRPGYYRQDYLSPQDLLTIDDNVGGSATDTNIPESGSSGTPGASPTTKEGVSGTQQPGSGPASKPVDNITGNNQNELVPDSYGSGYYGQDYLSPQDLLTTDDNVGGSATDTNIPESGSSGTPGASPTTKEGVSGTQRPESGPESKPASTASGNRRPGLDLYGSKYNGKYYPEISSAAATAVAGAFGTTSSSSVGTQGPEGKSTSAASSSSSSSVAGASGSIHGTQGSSERSEEGGAYGNASGRGGIHGPGSGSPSNSPTKKIDEKRTRLPESRPESKPASTASGNRRPGLDLYGLKYNGKYFPVISAAAAKAAAGGVGPDSYRPGYYRQDYLSPQDLLTIDDNVGGSATDTNIPESGSSGTSGASPTTKEGVSGTQQPESGPASKPVDNITGNNQNEKGPDSYGSGYYGQDYLSPQDLLTIDDNVGGSATDTNIPESGSSGTPGASPTTKEGVSGTQRPESGPVLKPASSASGNRRPGLDLYGSKYNGKYYPEISSAAATAVAGAFGTTSSSSARTHGPESRSTSTASSSSSRSGAGASGSIHGTQGSSERSEEGGAYGNASGRSGVHGPGSGSSGSPSNSLTKKIDETRTRLPQSRPVPKPASTASGNRRPGLDLYGSKYNGKYYPEISSAAATAVAGAFGTTSSSSVGTQGPEGKSTSAASSSSSSSVAGASGSIHGTQGSSERSEEGRAYGNASGRGGIHGPGSGSLGSPSNSPTKKIDEKRTRLPESRPESKPASTASGNRRPGLDLYGLKYNRKYFPEISAAAAKAAAGGVGPDSYRPGYYRQDYLSPQDLLTIDDNVGGSATDTNIPESGSSGTSGASPTTKEGVSGTQQPESGPASKPVDNITGNNQNEIGPDSYGSGYYGQDYLSPQDLLTIDDNAGGSATDTNIPESGSSGTSGASPTTKEGVSGTQQPGSGPASKPVDNITGNNQNEIGPDSYGSGYYGQDYLSPQDLLTIDDNVGGSATDTNIPESGSSGTPGASPTTKEGVSGTQRPESGPVLKPASSASGNRRPGLDLYGSKYNGKYYPEISSAAATAVAGAFGTTSSSSARTHGPESRSTSTASSSSSRSGAGASGSIHGTQGSSERSEEGGAYGNASGRGGVHGPGSGSSGSPSNSPTKKIDETRTRLPESRPVPKPASTASGNRRPGLDLYGSKYNGKYYPEISSAAATAVAGAFGTTSSSSARTQGPEGKSTSAASSSSSSSVAGASGSIHGTQGSSERSEEGRAYGNASGRGGIHGPGSGSLGSPSNSPTKKIDEKRTRLPESRPESKPASTASGNRRPGLDLYGLKYNGKYFPEIRAAAAKAAAGGVGPDSYRPGYYRQDYLSPQDLLTIDDNVGGSATDTNVPESGSSGTPGASPTTKEGVTGTQQPGSGPASKPVDNITGNNLNELGPDSYGSGYYGQDYSAPEELPNFNNNKRGSESSSSPAARASAAGIPDSAGSPSGVASGVTSVQGRKRVRQACRLRSSQFVLRLGRRGQPCTFCY